MCSVPVANEHWLCDALYISPTIANLVSMAMSRYVNLNLIPLEFGINCQWRDDILYIQSSFDAQSVLLYTHTVKAALCSILIQCSHYTEEWVG